MFRLKVKEALQKKNVSQGALSRGANIPLNTVGKLVNNQSYIPSALTLAKVAKFLSIPMEELYTLDDYPPLPDEYAPP